MKAMFENMLIMLYYGILKVTYDLLNDIDGEQTEFHQLLEGLSQLEKARSLAEKVALDVDWNNVAVQAKDMLKHERNLGLTSMPRMRMLRLLQDSDNLGELVAKGEQITDESQLLPAHVEEHLEGCECSACVDDNDKFTDEEVLSQAREELLGRLHEQFGPNIQVDNLEGQILSDEEALEHIRAQNGGELPQAVSEAIARGNQIKVVVQRGSATL